MTKLFEEGELIFVGEKNGMGMVFEGNGRRIEINGLTKDECKDLAKLMWTQATLKIEVDEC